MRRTVVPHTTSTGAVLAPRAMDASADAVSFLEAVLVGAVVIIVVGLVGIVLS